MSLDVESIATKIRYYMGDPDTDAVSDSKLQYIVQLVIDKIGDDDDMECEVTYQALLKSLVYMSNNYKAGLADIGTTTSRMEKKGSRTIEVEYSDSVDSSDDNPWDIMYQDYLAHPEWICTDLIDTKISQSVVLIGGTEQKEYHRVRRNKNSRSPMDLNINREYKFRRGAPKRSRSFWEL